MDEWHRIEDALPEPTEKVLGWSSDEGEVKIVWRGEENTTGEGPWQTGAADWAATPATMTVSHWASLLKPPVRWGAPVW